MFEQTQPAVVERHVPQVCARVGESHLDTGLAGHLPEHLGAVIGNGRAPAQFAAMLEDEIEEGVHRVNPAALHTNLPEGLADHRRIRTFDDERVEEVAMPHADTEFRLVVVTEATSVLLIAQQLVAFDLLRQMQRRRTGTELLEDHQIDADGVDLERHRQMLPAESPPWRLTKPASGPIGLMAYGLDLTSAADSRLVLSSGRPKPSDVSA